MSYISWEYSPAKQQEHDRKDEENDGVHLQRRVLDES